MRTGSPGRADAQRGFAVVAVLLVLMALFALSAPFLVTARNAGASSAMATDQARMRLALDTAGRHARASLGDSHPARDVTPYHDTPEELEVTNDFPEGFYEAADPGGVMWDLQVDDLAGRVDLDSASPHVIANLLGCVARLTADLEADAEELVLSTAGGFGDSGFLWIEDELVAYTGREGTRLTGLVRGVGTRRGADGEAQDCGPGPPATHALGSYVLDQRAFALARWRLAGAGERDLATFDGFDQVPESAAHAMAEALPDHTLAVLERTASLHGGVAAGPRWQRPVRALGEVDGEPRPGCSLRVADARFFNPGCTVRVSDGRNTEFGIVRQVWRTRIELMDPLAREYDPDRLEVAALVRQPVNVNTAGPEVLHALVENLKLRHKQARITSSEADRLVEVIVASRPFTGFEDFVRRVVLPAGGFEPLPPDAPVVPEALRQEVRFGELRATGAGEQAGFLDEDDARALYKNARNANDNELGFSTMPFSFVSRDLYAMELRAAVNARSGAERARGVRETVELVVPQGDLLRVWARQIDFDEAPRLDRGAPGWMTGPNPTARHEEELPSRYPSRVRAHLGPYEARPQNDPPAPAPAQGAPLTSVAPLVFADEGEQGWAQPSPARADERGERQGRVLHFDDEAHGLEGRYLPDGALAWPPGAAPAHWARGSGAGLMEAAGLSFWLQPRSHQQGVHLVDAGGTFTDSDRVTLLFDRGELVLRVLDGAGDHPETSFVERTEVRAALAGDPTGAGGGGLPVDVWSHVDLGVSGNRADQVRLLVDGRLVARTTGLTRLTSGISPDSASIPVESTDGFPDRCVLRIGDELVEAVKGSGSFDATFHTTGELAGFGGRLARELFEGADPGFNLGVSRKQTAHPAGTPVELYGYSLPFTSLVPPTSARLRGALGAFAVARVTDLVMDDGSVDGDGGERIEARFQTTAGAIDVPVGWGLEGDSDGDVAGLVLAPADEDVPIAEVMAAFSPNGGYAVIVGQDVLLSLSTGGGSTQLDKDGYHLGGIEVIWYTGWQGDQLFVGRRGDVVQGELSRLGASAGGAFGGRRSFIVRWNETNVLEGAPYNASLARQVKVFPISVGADGVEIWTLPANLDSDFAQLTHTGADADQTEWVRYDDIVNGHLVRSDPAFLEDARLAALGDVSSLQPSPIVPPRGTNTPTGPNLPNLPNLPNTPTTPTSSANLVAAPPPAPRAARARAPRLGAYWEPTMGEPARAPEDAPVTAAVSSHLQFRGVLGTHSHAHAGGLLVLPVWRTTNAQDPAGGWPGRLDAVALFDGDESHPAFHGVVQHAHRPNEVTLYDFLDAGTLEGRLAGSPATTTHLGFPWQDVHVALREPAPFPFVPGAPSLGVTAGTGASASAPAPDARLVSRMTLFPSGERPRLIADLRLGGSVEGGVGVPSATVDEVVFTNDRLDHQLVLARDVGSTATALEIRGLRVAGGDRVLTSGALAGLPPTGGLLRIGGELLAYQSHDGASVLQLATNGRGLLGSRAQPHPAGAGIAYLDDLRVAILVGAMDATQAFLPVPAHREFPQEGTVLVDQELLHYTRIVPGGLEMPAGSSLAGRADGRGRGLFRGRYGTRSADHASGTAAILFPIRYWDRWTPEAEAPELDFYGLSLHQPGAWWKRVFWEEEAAATGGAHLQVLQRSDPRVPWDADPARHEGLELLEDGALGRGGHRLLRTADRVEWRAHVVYDAGAFDPLAGSAHGWKTAPRLRLFGAELAAPRRVYRRVDR